MPSVSIAERLAGGGLQQHFFAEPSIVAEACRTLGQSCWSDDACCDGLLCEWWTCRKASDV